MSCVIPHIRKYTKYCSDSEHRKQVKNLIKTFFHGLSVEKITFSQYLFWAEYTLFDNNNGSFYGDEFIWKSKEIRNRNRDLWHQKH